MKLKKFKQNKLWRDNVVALMEKEGFKVHFKKLDDTEFSEKLKEKIVEEAQELYGVQKKEILIHELADILEAITELGNVHKFSMNDIIEIQTKKRKKRSGYSGRTYVISAEYPVGSAAEKHCLQNPKKYPEITD